MASLLVQAAFLIEERSLVAFLHNFFAVTLLRYLEGVGITPSQPVVATAETEILPVPVTTQPVLLEELWEGSDAAAYNLTHSEFNKILLQIGNAQNYGQPSEEIASQEQQAAFFRNLRLPDLVLARACAD